MIAGGEQTYLAFDLGASSGRAILGWVGPDGLIRPQEVRRFPNGHVRRGDGLFWDLDGLFEMMLDSMRIVAGRGVRPRAIGVDTWGLDFALLDEAGKLLAPPRSYRDPGNVGAGQQITEKIGAQRLQDRTGAMHQDHSSLCQYSVLARRQGELLARAQRLLFIPDLLRYWLCGDESTDVTSASASQMYDVPAREWADDILRELDLRTDVLPEVHVGPTVVGTLGKDIRAKTGLGQIPVVAGAGHDTGAAFATCLPFARGPVSSGQDLPDKDDLAVISSGTWSILGVFVDGHLPAGSLPPAQFGYEANPDGSLRIVRNLAGGWLLEQCRQVWRQQGFDCAYESLIAAGRAAASTDNASAIVDSQWEGFYNPTSMPQAMTEYCERTGQPAPITPGEFTQVIFASLADSYAGSIQLLRERTGRALSNLYMIGGMSRNEYLNELTARRAGVRVIVGPAEAAAVGNVAVQMAAGC